MGAFLGGMALKWFSQKQCYTLIVVVVLLVVVVGVIVLSLVRISRILVLRWRLTRSQNHFRTNLGEERQGTRLGPRSRFAVPIVAAWWCLSASNVSRWRPWRPL